MNVVSIVSREQMASFVSGKFLPHCRVSYPNSIHLAAQGWLDLGNHTEAHNELEKLPFDQRTYLEVLKVRCRYRQAEKWDYIATLAESCYSAHPQEPQF